MKSFDTQSKMISDTTYLNTQKRKMVCTVQAAQYLADRPVLESARWCRDPIHAVTGSALVQQGG